MDAQQKIAFKEFISESGMKLDEDALSYGSEFLTAKLAFVFGWFAAKDTSHSAGV